MADSDTLIGQTVSLSFAKSLADLKINKIRRDCITWMNSSVRNYCGGPHQKLREMNALLQAVIKEDMEEGRLRRAFFARTRGVRLMISNERLMPLIRFPPPRALQSRHSGTRRNMYRIEIWSSLGRQMHDQDEARLWCAKPRPKWTSSKPIA